LAGFQVIIIGRFWVIPEGVTPAMAAGLTERLWEIEDLVGLLD
jgi:hypothetical protein